MNDDERLEARVLKALRGVVGRELTSVAYRILCEPDEIDVTELGARELFIGGELLLVFDERFPLVLTWDHGVGWVDAAGYPTYSVQARTTTASVEGGVRPVEASGFDLWRMHAGHPLSEVRVHGQDGVPFVLELRFPTGVVLVGNGSRYRFGDGDDTVVKGAEHIAELASFDVLAELAPDP